MDWNENTLNLAVGILQKSTSLQKALDAFSDTVGEDISRHALRRAFLKNGLESPSLYLQSNPSQERLETFEAILSNPAESPPIRFAKGQSLKGQSLLLSPDGTLKERWDKSHQESRPTNFPAVPPGHLIRKTTTAYGPNGEPRLQYITSEPGKNHQWKEFWKACEENAKKYTGIALPINPPGYTDEELWSVYPIGDAHLGMLSWAPETGADFDLSIAKRDLLECFEQLISGAPPSRQATIINLGDFFHTQDDTQLTPEHKNKLDVDSRFPKIMDAGHEILRVIVDLALQKHEKVTVVNLPGNHDPRVAYELAAWLSEVYRNLPRVTVSKAYSPIYYESFGKCLIGSTHGDGAKAGDLPLLMATEQPSLWGQTEFRHWHCGHVHHSEIHEYAGCMVEYHNTLASKDAYHTKKGYRSRQLLKCITYHRDFGEVGRNTVGLEKVRAKLAKEKTTWE